MSAIEAIAAVGAESASPIAMQLGGTAAAAPQAGAPGSFGEVLMAGLRGVDAKVANADQLARQFAVDDSIPVHQVTIALAEARLSVELAMQFRARMLESYRELMNMQL